MGQILLLLYIPTVGMKGEIEMIRENGAGRRKSVEEKIQNMEVQ